MVDATTRLTGHPAQKLKLQEFDSTEEFDGIWACASLLHVPLQELDNVVARLTAALRPNGVCYLSFKEGSGERTEGDRLFVDFTEAGLRDWLNQRPVLERVRTWMTTDLRPGRNQRWVNALVRKV